MNNDLELIYKFAQKHKIRFNFYDNFEDKVTSAWMVFYGEDEYEIIFDYIYYQNFDRKRIQIGFELKSELSVEDALKYYEDLILLHKPVKM